MCDKFIQFLDKYKHFSDKVPCSNCEAALSSCVVNKTLAKLVVNKFRINFHRCGYYEIDMFVRIAILAIQHSEFNYVLALSHLYEHHRHRFRNLVYNRVVITEEYKAKMVMLIFIDDCIKLFSVSARRA